MQIDNQWLKVTRHQRGWTQADLAQLLDVSDRTVQRIEATGAVSAENLKGICALFEIEPKEILKSEASNAHIVVIFRAPFIIFFAGLVVGVAISRFWG